MYCHFTINFDTTIWWSLQGAPQPVTQTCWQAQVFLNGNMHRFICLGNEKPKVYRGSRKQLHSFLTSALDRGKNFRYWVGSRADWRVLGGEIFCVLLETQHPNWRHITAPVQTSLDPPADTQPQPTTAHSYLTGTWTPLLNTPSVVNIKRPWHFAPYQVWRSVLLTSACHCWMLPKVQHNTRSVLKGVYP